MYSNAVSVRPFGRPASKEVHPVSNSQVPDHPVPSTDSPSSRSAATRRRIRTAFLTLLRRMPIHAISVKELCALGGVSRGTFYAHYEDVYDLLHRIEDEMTGEIAAALEPIMSTLNRDNPVNLSARIFQILKDNSDLCTVTLSEYGDKDFAERLIGMGRDKCIELYRSYFQNVPPEAVDYYYAFVSSGILGLLRRWLEDGTAASPESIARLAEGIMLYGIGTFRQMPPDLPQDMP